MGKRAWTPANAVRGPVRGGAGFSKIGSCVSANPCCIPCMLNGWQGQPATYRSTDLAWALSRLRMSSYIRSGGKLAKIVARASESTSQEKRCSTGMPRPSRAATGASMPEQSVPKLMLTSGVINPASIGGAARARDSQG